MLGLTADKILILIVIVALLLGPDQLPLYAARLARLVRRGKGLLASAQDRAREELGPEFAEVDWKKLDPRQYDPRQIVRQVLLEESPSATSALAAPDAESSGGRTPPAGEALRESGGPHRP